MSESDTEYKTGAATPATTLRDHIMNPNIPKSEAEWWARRELERLTRVEVLAKAACDVWFGVDIDPENYTGTELDVAMSELRWHILATPELQKSIENLTRHNSIMALGAIEEALEGACITMEAWCPGGRDPANSDNYCRVSDLLGKIKEFRKGNNNE